MPGDSVAIIVCSVFVVDFFLQIIDICLGKITPTFLQTYIFVHSGADQGLALLKKKYIASQFD